MTNRYKTLIKSALEIQQKRKEIEILLNDMRENILASEPTERRFLEQDAKDAIILLKEEGDLKIETTSYVKSKAIYKDLEIHLHCDPDPKNGYAMMKEILKGVSIRSILGS